MGVTKKPVVKCAQPLAAYGADVMVLAEQYLDAFSALDVRAHPDRLRPGYFLLGHSTELGLKAFLFNRGVSYVELRDSFGHGHRKLLKEAQQRGLPEIPKLGFLINALAQMSEGNSLRYPKYTYLSVPSAEECGEVCGALLSAIGSKVKLAGLSSLMRLRAHHPGCDFDWEGDPAP